MADATVVAIDPPLTTTDHGSGLSIPPLDTAFFSQQLIDNDGDNHNDVAVEDLDFDFSFDDLWMPSADDLEDLLNPAQLLEFDSQPAPDSNPPHVTPIFDEYHDVFKSNSLDLHLISEDGDDRSPNGSGLLNSASPGLESQQISGYLDTPSPESNGSNHGISEKCGGDVKVTNCPSSESWNSGNCTSNLCEDSNNRATRSVTSSPDLNKGSIRIGVVNQNIKLEESSQNKMDGSLLKRKKDCEELMSNTAEPRINKCRKSDCNSENNSDNNKNVGLTDVEEKRKARLMRNRESAQLSRQRKKQYVDELEDKVKMMQSTIQDLNAKISYFMAENATLRQQMGGGGGAVPPPGMYPHPAMAYPWMPCAASYMMKPQGSQVPLVPIPRLKPQQPTKSPKNKKPENKKNEGSKTKKVAGVSFLGLLFFILLFGGLVPMINLRYGGVRETLAGGESYGGGGFYEKHHGRVLMANGTEYGDRRDFGCKSSVHCGRRGCDREEKPSDDEFARLSNASEHLAASLYVPRNDKLVKIDGNLIIHSVLASEKTMSSHGGGGDETGLAIPGDLGAAIHVPIMGQDSGRQPHLRALGSGSVDEDSRKPKATDGRLQQWFREGFTGPMLSSGMCTEVFQFDVSSASTSGAIVPSTTTRNISEEQSQSSTHLSKGGKNRRILQGLHIPLSESSGNVTSQNVKRNSQKENWTGNNSISPMVVSVLVDPREAADAGVDGVVGTKSISRIFVVVLIDSVKYVTYSCILPFKGAAHHLVTA